MCTHTHAERRSHVLLRITYILDIVLRAIILVDPMWDRNTFFPISDLFLFTKNTKKKIAQKKKKFANLTKKEKKSSKRTGGFEKKTKNFVDLFFLAFTL